MHKKLHIDLECWCGINLNKCGVYRYAEDPSFEILLWGYAWDDGPVHVIDLANGEHPPESLIEALHDPEIEKWSHNVAFERTALNAWLKKQGDPRFLEPEGWYCSMIWAATLGLPLSLKNVGSLLGLEKQKLEEGKELIRYFCLPCRPSRSNNYRTRSFPHHHPQKWELFKSYNRRDVEVERAIQKKLSVFPVPDQIWQEFWLDQRINDRGIRIDRSFVESAIEVDRQVKKELMDRMQELTHLENPNSVVQLKGWLERSGMELESLGKKQVAAALKDAPEDIQQVLSLRLQLAKSSIKKYEAMKNCVCADGRARGMFQFYGASRTGRFSGRLLQLQNLPQNHLPDLKEARDLVLLQRMDGLKLLYGDLPDTLSQLIRTAFIPENGRKFIVADFSAIEARVLAWLAKETWRIEVFERGEDIYCASASAMFGVPVEKHGMNSHLRQKGKVAELALGYGGSAGALVSMGALEMGLEETELKPLAAAWRAANPCIVSYWWKVDRAVKEALLYHRPSQIGCVGFFYKKGFLFITLPSGRRLAYVKPRIEENRFGGESVTYEGTGPSKKWERLESYGPKFVENITQAIARDILCHSLQVLQEESIAAHVHDEIIIEADPRTRVETICEKMAQLPDWAAGLPLRADGYECLFYRKD